ncbi:MAG: stage V sporulation protein S [Anaerolineae bacterium]|nr:stage V sporulation protein S [Anaerolineae bacterium]
MSVIKVSARSRTAAVAGAVAGVIRESQKAEVQAIGAGAVNQALKAIVIAKGYLAEEGVEVMCDPSFVDVSIDGQERTAIRIVVEPRSH